MAAHHAERAARVAAAERVALEQDHAPGARGGTAGRRWTSRRARRRSPRRLRARSWAASIGTRSRGAAVRNGPLIRSASHLSGRRGGHGAEPAGRLAVRPQQNHRARTHVRVVAVPRRALGRPPERGGGGVRRRRRGHRALRAGDGHRAARRDAAACRSARRTRSTSPSSRSTTPGCATTGRSSSSTGAAASPPCSFGFNAWGGKFAPFADDAQLPARLAPAARDARLRGAARRRGRRADVRRRGHADHDGVGPAQPEPQPRPHARGGRGAAARLPRDREGDLAARRPRRGSRHRRALRQHHAVRATRRRARPDGARSLESQLGRRSATTSRACAGRPTRRAASSRSSRCRCCRTSRSTASSSSCRTPTTTPSTAASSRRSSATPDDEAGFALLRELFPDREVVGAPSRLLAYGGGGIGCITQQLPAGMALAPSA